jgi:hypothetical protein
LGNPGYPGNGYHHAATDSSDQQGHPKRDGASQTEEVDFDLRRILQNEDDKQDQD